MPSYSVHPYHSLLSGGRDIVRYNKGIPWRAIVLRALSTRSSDLTQPSLEAVVVSHPTTASKVPSAVADRVVTPWFYASEEVSVVDLQMYGKILRSYTGSGLLCFEDGSELRCTFELAQICTGGLYASCRFQGIHSLMRGLGDQVVKLVGQVGGSRRVIVTGLAVVRSTVDFSDGSSSTACVVRGNEATIGEVGASQDTETHLRFGLTNLTMLGTAPFTTERSDGSVVDRLQLPLKLDDVDVVLRPIDGYREVIEDLKASRNVDVTCEARIEMGATQRKEDAVRIADDLCTLLTLARGCRVEWLYYDVIGSDGQLLQSYHRSAITKPFGILSLIATIPPEDTLDFINQAYSPLDVQEQPWELRKAINAYTDAKLEADFLEARGLKMVVIMEHLKGRYLSQNDKTHILNPEVFGDAEKSLIKVVRDALPEVFPRTEAWKLDMMTNHARGFNWYPFRRALADLCDSVGLRVSSRERGRLVSVRNELVHRMGYDPELGRPWEQYAFLMTFVGRILLAILGYKGHYYDWTKKPRWISRDAEMRVRLELGS